MKGVRSFRKRLCWCCGWDIGQYACLCSIYYDGKGGVEEYCAVHKLKRFDRSEETKRHE